MGSVLSACSTHPLIEDVADLPVSQIVHQIECEAAREVKEWHAHLGYTERSKELAAINQNIKKYSKAYEDSLGELAKQSDYGTTSGALEDAFDAVNLQLDQVQQKIKQSTSGSDKQTLENEGLQLYRQYKSIVVAAALYASASENGKLLQLEKAKLTDEPGKSRYRDVNSFERNNAAFQFVFEATEVNNASSKGTITWPITPGVITLGYGAGDERKRASDRQVKVAATFRELVLLDCDRVTPPTATRLPRMYPITGEIGLHEVIWEYMVISHRIKRNEAANFGPGNAGDSYRDKITFTTTIGGGLAPGINLSKRMGQLIDVSADLSATRVDQHQLTILLTPPDPTPRMAPPQEIIIREMPAVRARARLIEQSPSG